jgi:AbrB family looped-hinge helix DNA binding protein
MIEARVKINDNGRVVIPASIREALGVKAGDDLVMRMEGDELRITSQRQRILKAQRLIRDHVEASRSLSDELIAERREAAKRE